MSLIDATGAAYIGHNGSAPSLSAANVRILANSLDFAGGAASNTFTLDNSNFVTRMTANLAGGDVTIGSTSVNMAISSAWSASSASSRNLNFISYGTLTVNNNITHSGNGGRVNLVSGWDKTNGLNANGSINFDTLRLRGGSSNLTLASGAAVTAGANTGTGILAAADGYFINNNAAGGLSASASRYIIYSTSSLGTTLGTLSPTALYGGYVSNLPSGVAAGNRIIYDLYGLTITVNPATRTYGSANPAFSFADFSAQLQGGDTMANITGGSGLAADVSYTLATPVGTSSNAGVYSNEIGISLASLDGNNAGNYDISIITGTLTVNKASLTLNPTAQTYTYTGTAAPFTNAFTLSGCVAGDDCSAYTALAGFSGSATVNASDKINAGTRDITSSGSLAFSNYSVAYAVNTNGLVINRVILNLSGTRAYDAMTAFSSVNFGSSGIINTGVNNETLSLSGTGSVPLSTVAAGTQTLSLGTLTLGNGTGLASNYTLTGGVHTAAITPRPITVVATSMSKTYGAADAALIYTITSGNLLSGDSLGGSLARASGENVGNYIISQNTLSNSNYALTFVDGVFAITPRPITLRPNAVSRPFAAANPTSYSYSVIGGSVLSGDALGTAVYTVPWNASTPAGTLTYSMSGLSNTNYSYTYQVGEFVITPVQSVPPTTSAVPPTINLQPIFRDAVARSPYVATPFDGANAGDLLAYSRAIAAQDQRRSAVPSVASVISYKLEYGLELKDGWLVPLPANKSDPAPVSSSSGNRAAASGVVLIACNIASNGLSTYCAGRASQ